MRTSYAEWKRNDDLLHKRGLADRPAEELVFHEDPDVRTWLRNRGSAEGFLRFELVRIWRATGRCEFASIAPKDLVHHMPSIIDGYDRFILKNEHRPMDEVMRPQVLHNIDLLTNDNYAWDAFSVLGDIVCFLPSFWTSRHTIGDWEFLTPEERHKVRCEMRDWYQANSRKLQWCSKYDSFTPCGTGLGFEWPKYVRDTVGTAHREDRIRPRWALAEKAASSQESSTAEP